MKRILDFVAKNPVMYVASVDGDKPRVRPFGSIMEHEGKIYMGMGDWKESYHQLKANPNIEFCTCSPEGRFLRVRGKAVFDERPDIMDEFYRLEPELLDIYKNQGLNMATFYISEGYAEFQGGSEGFEKFNF